MMEALTERFSQASREIGNRVELDPAELLARDASLGLGPPGRWSPNRHCRLVQAANGWLAVNLARPDDAETVPAWLGGPPEEPAWGIVERLVPAFDTAELLDRAIELHLPVSRAGEASPAWPDLQKETNRRDAKIKVVDLSALWAGPLAGGLLARCGAEVVKVDSPTRPDPTPRTTPELDRRLNGQKRRATLGFGDPALSALIDDASVLITSGRPHALARAGLDPERILPRNAGLLWIMITAHDDPMRVGFGDDCAAAGGLLDWQDGTPSFRGDALGDPCAGLIAAIAALDCLKAGQGGLLRVSLAGCAAWVAQ